MNTYSDYGSAFLSGYGRGRNFSRAFVAGTKKNSLESNGDESVQLSFKDLLLQEFKATEMPVAFIPRADSDSSSRHVADRSVEQRAVQMLNEFWA